MLGTLLVLAVVSAAGAARGADASARPGKDLARWRFAAEIKPGPAATAASQPAAASAPTALPAGGLVEFELTPEAISHARRDLGDLRLVNAAGHVVPHITRSGRATDDSAFIEARRLFDRSAVSGGGSGVSADFGASLAKNQIEVLSLGRDFCRQVRVEGSADGKTWQRLGRAGWVFRLSHENGAYVKSSAAVPENDFRYVRVTVTPGANDTGDVQIVAVGARRRSEPRGDVIDIPLPTGSVKITERPELKCTDIEADLGLASLPLSRVELCVSNKRFMRRVEVLGRDQEKIAIGATDARGRSVTREVPAPWRSLGGGVIYRLGDLGEGAGRPRENVGIGLVEGCRYLRVRLYNGGSALREANGQPLWLSRPVLKVYRPRLYAAFDARAAGPGPWKLYVGNQRAAEPDCGDLAERAAALRAQPVAVAHMGPLSRNESQNSAAPAAQVPFSRRYRNIIWPMMALLGVAAFIMTRRQFRRARRRA